MARRIQGFPPPEVEPQDVLAFVLGLLDPLAVRYERLAARARETGREESARLFTGLAREQRDRIARLRTRARELGIPDAEARPVPAGLLDEELLQSLELWEHRPELATPYRALAVAVGFEDALFRLCSGLEATARYPEAARLAEDLAREALAEAARLRARRRAAYHATEPESGAGPPPRRLTSLAELEAAARPIESELARLLRIACARDPSLARALARHPALGPFRGALEETAEEPGAVGPGEPGEDARGRLRLAVERAFEFYDRLFAGAAQEEVMQRAQERMQHLLALLHALDSLEADAARSGTDSDEGGEEP